MNPWMNCLVSIVVTLDGNSSVREVAREGDKAPGGGRFGPSSADRQSCVPVSET